MREILFRGFTPDEKGKDEILINGKSIKGQWVQGSYWKLNKTTYCFKEDYESDPDNTQHYIVFDQMTDWGLPNRHLQADVIPETVGQYTGLTDKNGKKIFEGDIVKVYARGYHTICTVSWAETVAHFQLWQINTIPNTPTVLNLGNYDCEVIGNIHDNPELLKGGAE